MLAVLTVYKCQGKAPCPREGPSPLLFPKPLPGGRSWGRGPGGGLGTHCKGFTPSLPLPMPGRPEPDHQAARKGCSMNKEPGQELGAQLAG